MGAIDTLHEAELAGERDQAAEKALGALKGLTMTVIDGEFPGDYLKDHDLTITRYEMGGRQNNRLGYDCTIDGPGYAQEGVLIEGEKGMPWYKRIWQ